MTWKTLRRLYFVTAQMARRDIAQQYRGSIGGILWSTAQPLMMLCVYTFVFGVVIKVKWPGVNGALDYALIMFLGIVPYMFVSESMMRAPALVVEHVNLVKKVLFPVSVLPIMSCTTAAIHTAMALLVWGCAYWIIMEAPPWQMLIMPLLWIPMILATVGVCWIFASIGTYFRDVTHAMAPVTLALMLLSPIFYSASMVPEKFRPVVLDNPLGFAIHSARDLAFHGRWPNAYDFLWQFVAGCVLFFVGLSFFRRTKSGFADVL